MSGHIAGEKYPTLCTSLQIYTALLGHVQQMRNDAIGNVAFSNGVDACEEKLLKFFDKSTFESEYYYFAAGEHL